MFGPKGPFCQSCGMPLSKDKGGGATEADGSHSPDFCSNCYRDGRFTQPDITVEDMQERVLGRMREMRIPGFVARRFTKGIPKLKRWAGSAKP